VQQTAQPFNPAEVPINYTLNFQQVNVLLEGLGKLPFEKVEQLYLGMRSVALQTLQGAEAAHKEAAEKAAAAEANRNAPPEVAGSAVGGTD
jgi:hypothetical protein